MTVRSIRQQVLEVLCLKASLEVLLVYVHLVLVAGA
jgi:hypothetical protein